MGAFLPRHTGPVLDATAALHASLTRDDLHPAFAIDSEFRIESQIRLKLSALVPLFMLILLVSKDVLCEPNAAFESTVWIHLTLLATHASC